MTKFDLVWLRGRTAPKGGRMARGRGHGGARPASPSACPKTTNPPYVTKIYLFLYEKKLNVKYV